MTRAGRQQRWDAHPVLGIVLRLVILLAPVVVGVLVATSVAAALPAPDGTGQTVLWWVAVLGGSLAAMLLTDRLARRLLPLAVLLELCLVFPDRAPSRLKAARTTSVRDMENRLARLRREGEPMEEHEAAETLVVLVGMLGLHDKRTRGHSERVRAFTDLLTDELDLSEDDRSKVRWAALVHDLGKLVVPGSILNGGRDLSSDDWAVLHRHPEEGERLVAGLLPWLGEWGAAVVEHHERWDGAGYPRGLAEEQISYAGRIVALADSFEVMTAARSYKSPMSATEARRELTRCAGAQFDPALVRAFLGISLGKLRWVLGPFTWLASMPFLPSGERAGSAVKAGATAGAVAGLVAIGGLTPPQPSTGEVRPPLAAAEESPAPVATPGAPAEGAAGDGSSSQDPGALPFEPGIPEPGPDLLPVVEPEPVLPTEPVPPPAAPVDRPVPAEPPPTEPVPTTQPVPTAEPVPTVSPEPPPSPTPAPEPAPTPTPTAEPSPIPSPEPSPTTPPSASPSPAPSSPAPTASPSPSPTVLQAFLDLPASLAPAAPGAQETLVISDAATLEGPAPEAFRLDPSTPPSADLFADFANSPGQSGRLQLDLQACAATCTSIATGEIGKSSPQESGLRSYSVVLTPGTAVDVAAGDVLRLVLTETGGGQSSVVLASGGSSPSRIDLPATVLRTS